MPTPVAMGEGRLQATLPDTSRRLATYPVRNTVCKVLSREVSKARYFALAEVVVGLLGPSRAAKISDASGCAESQ
jgi:hypothetical protein